MAEPRDTTTEPDTARRQLDRAPLTAKQDERSAIFSHLGGVVGFLPALLVFVVLGERGERTGTESAEALNFQATIGVPVVSLYVLSGLTAGIPTVGGAIGIVLWTVAGLLLVVGAVFSVVAAVFTWRRGTFRYPFAVRLIRPA